MAQYLRILMPSPISSPTFPFAIANTRHRPLQCAIFSGGSLQNVITNRATMRLGGGCWKKLQDDAVGNTSFILNDLQDILSDHGL
jgi:hypothetical protein